MGARPTALLLVLLCSCSGNGGDPVDDAGPSDAAMTAACASYGEAYCTRLDACLVSSVGQRYGDVATCKDRVALGCRARGALPGSGRTASEVDACARALSAGTCNGLRGDLVPDACLPRKGTLADGTACFDDSQCASAYCDGSSAMCGGRCRAAGVLGAACSDPGSCGRALTCTDGKCARPVPSTLDDFCTGPDTCDVGLACQGGRCQKPAAEGQACDRSWATAPDCNPEGGLVCVGAKCLRLVLGPPGAACDPSFSGPNQCARGECYEGKCRAFVADGGDCTANAICLGPARCDRGVCKTPTELASACGA